MRTRLAAALICGVAATHADAAPKFSTIYNFHGASDGDSPSGALVQGPDGALYGVTAAGGPGGGGTVFQLKAPAKKNGAWTQTTLHGFAGGTDGSGPSGGVVFDSAGNIYGVTSAGGSAVVCGFDNVDSCGTVYRLAPPAQPGGVWTETVLYTFASNSDGYDPSGRLLLGKKGEIYGTTQEGGGAGGASLCGEFVSGCGDVFELVPPASGHTAWAKTILHAFSGGADGAAPLGGLRARGAGLIGTAASGGASGNADDTCGYPIANSGCGVVFSLMPGAAGQTWTETVLYAFNGAAGDADGWTANDSLLQGGKFYYGSTQGGPSTSSNQGTIFAVAPPAAMGGAWTETVLHSFGPADGTTSPVQPVGGLVTVKGEAGTLYGASTSNTGTGAAGTVFRLRPPGKNQTSWHETTLHVFNGPDGAQPEAGLTVDSAGTLFGTTAFGGSSNDGTVFEITP
jgi:uncharacterized repeat protein (TIGR03803 family)